MWRWTMVAGGLAFAAAVAQAQETVVARGSSLLEPFKHELQQALRQGLSEGPVEAIAACRVKAPEIARAQSRDGIRLGRTSHRLRNPYNAAPEWVHPILESYVASPSSLEPRAVSLPNGQSGYVEPILLQPLCVTCHGDELGPDVAARINELYPEDRAVGFAVGELRGVFWVAFPAQHE